MENILHIGLNNALMATALAALVALVARFIRIPPLVHSLWLLVLLKLITPPLVSFEISWPKAVLDNGSRDQKEDISVARGGPVTDALQIEPSQVVPSQSGSIAPEVNANSISENSEPTTGSGGEVSFASTPASPQVDFGWKQVLAAAWLIGSFLWALVVVWRIYCFRKTLKDSHVAPAELQEEAQRLAQHLGLSICPQVWLVPGRVSPMLWAMLGKARILLPGALVSRMASDQRATLLVHELAHWRRRDHWIRFVELLATGAYWWHPVVWWARRELATSEEECCDAWVVWVLPGAARIYALTLLETVDFLAASQTVLPPAASGVGHVQILRRRLTMIMSAKTPRRLTRAGLLIALGLAVVLLPWFPIWGQQQPRVQTEVLLAAGTAPGDVSTVFVNPNPKEQLERARDDIQVLEAKLAIKHAQLEEIEVRFKQSADRQARLDSLFRNGTVDQATREAAINELELMKSQLRIKQAELKEPELLLQQAQRRLAALQQRLKELDETRSEAQVQPLRGQPMGRPIEKARPKVAAPAGAFFAAPPAEAQPPPPAPMPFPASPTVRIRDLEQKVASLEKTVGKLRLEMDALRKESQKLNRLIIVSPNVAMPFDPNKQPLLTPYQPVPLGPNKRPLLRPNQPVPRDIDPRSVPTVPLSPANAAPSVP